MIERSIRLDELPAGQFATISRVEGEGDHVHRLRELGISGGTRVRMFRPGNPCIIRMGNSKVCIRADRSLRVLVEPDLTDV